MGLFDKIFKKKEPQQETVDQGLKKTSDGFFSKISKAIAGKSTIDEEVLDNLENALVGSDVGIDTTVKIIDLIEKRVAKDKYLNTSDLNMILLQEMQTLMVNAPENQSYKNFQLPQENKPHIILVVGVNGVGKTTTIGKLAYNFKKAG
ncbi:MAG: signal recognition particle receptor subunit alpha, partial [Ferruginibacter sp.]